MRVKPCNIRIPSSLSDAQVAADAACAAKRYAYSAEQVESRLNSYVDELTGLDLEQIAANTAAAADVVERAEAAAETAQSSAEVVETLAAEVKEIHDAIIEQDLEQLRQDIETVTDLISTVDGKVSAAQQAAEDAIESASSARQSETTATAALTDTWTAYSAILNEKDNAAAHFTTEAEEKVAEAVTAQLNPGGDFYAAVNTAVHDTIPSVVKEEADGYVTQITAEGGSLYNYVEESKADIASAKEEAIESIGEKVDADITAKINPEYISEKVNDVLPELIDKELADENGAWNTAKNEAIADATEQAELAKQWATSETHVADTSYSGAYGYMLMAEGLAEAAAQAESTAVDAAGRATESASAASVSANAAATSETNAAGSATRAESAQDLAGQHASYAESFAAAAYGSAGLAANSESNAKESETAAANSETNAASSASAAASSETNAAGSADAARLYSISASNSADAARLYSISASNSADAAELYSLRASTSATYASNSENMAGRYMEVAEAFALNDYEGGFIIRDTDEGPVVEPYRTDYSDGQVYSSAKTYAETARSSANDADYYANTAYSWAEGDSSRSARAYANKAEIYANTAYSWAAFDTVFTYSIDGYSQPMQGASARTWAEAEESFSLNGEEHKSAKAYAELAKNAEAEALLHANQANGAAADAATAYEGTLNAYESTLDAYEATKAAVVTAENYMTEVNAAKSAIDQTLISSNWTANNIPVDASGAFSVAIGLVYAVWSKEACEIYKDAALENKLCTIWAEEQRCILATQATYYVSPVEQAASVIITSVQYTQPSA